jgi:hypothetical protein
MSTYRTMTRSNIQIHNDRYNYYGSKEEGKEEGSSKAQGSKEDDKAKGSKAPPLVDICTAHKEIAPSIEGHFLFACLYCLHTLLHYVWKRSPEKYTGSIFFNILL